MKWANAVKGIVLFSAIFAFLSAIGFFFWSPFASADVNTMWQMFLNVLYGALLTAALTTAIYVVQWGLQKGEEDSRRQSQEKEENSRRQSQKEDEDRRRNLLHRQEIARAHKIKLYNEMLAFATDSLFKDETIDDVKKIEGYIYQLVMYSNANVIYKALKMFEQAINTKHGEHREYLVAFAEACNKDLYQFDSDGDNAGNFAEINNSIGNAIRSFQAKTLNLNSRVKPFFS